MAILPLHQLSYRRADEGDLSTSIKIVLALAAAVVFASLGIITWRILAWQKRRVGAARSTSASVRVAVTLPELEKGTHLEFDSSQFYLDLPPKAKMLGTTTTTMKKSIRSKLPPIPSPKQSPPPAYVPSAPGMQQPPATAQNTSKPKPTMLTVDHLPQDNMPLVSPIRTASFQPPSVGGKNPNGKSACGKKLPRLMTVVATYVPSLNDELAIKVGESVRMLEEYEDEWCLVQYVGRTDDKKGVCPRFCLVERQDIIPRQRKGASINFPMSTASYPVSTYYK